MKKLTAEKCREQIAEWEKMMKDWDLSIESFKHLQAYRIALPILEQQERGDGWIEWKGVGRPTSTPYQIVEYRTRLGNVSESAAGDLRWNHEGKGGDIIAYRIIPEQPTNQNGEQ